MRNGRNILQFYTDEDTGDTSSEDEDGNDINKSSDSEEESRLTQAKPPNDILDNEIWHSDDEDEEMEKNIFQ